jgi:DNA damage-binding protein 1
VSSEKTAVTEKGEESLSRILFFDDGSFDLIGSYDLDYLEQGISIATVQFEGTTNPFFVIGTAQVVNDELEPSKGRILIFEITAEKKINLLTERETKSGVYSLVAIQGKLAAGIGSKVSVFSLSFLYLSLFHFKNLKQVQIYKLVIKDENAMVANNNTTTSSSSAMNTAIGASSTVLYELQNECHHQGHIMTLYLKSLGDCLIVGDLVRSISLLKYRSTENTLEEIARDFNSNFMRAVEILEENYYLGCDDHGNLFNLQRPNASAGGSTAGEEENLKLEVKGEYHVGDYVNVMRKGSLILQPIENTAAGTVNTTTASGNMDISSHNNNTNNNNNNNNIPTGVASTVVSDIFESNYKTITGYYPTEKYNVMYGTISGAVGNIIALTESSYQFFAAVEKVMKNYLTPIGGFAHEDYRSFQNEMRSSPQKNVLDGDVIETLLDLNKDQLEMICKEINEELSANASAATVGNAGNSPNATSTSSGGGQANTTSSAGPAGSGGPFVTNLIASRVQFTSEDIYRRVEDMARLH